jgi:hypothetical protein
VSACPSDWNPRARESSSSRAAKRSKGPAVDDREVWAAIMLALDVETCESLLSGRFVRAGNLDGLVLRRALRGEPLPDYEDYIEIGAAMLDAVAEAGPLPVRKGRK